VESCPSVSAVDEHAEGVSSHATRRPPSRRRRVLSAVGSVAVVALIFFGLLRDTDLAEVWRAIRDMTGVELVALLVVALWNLASYWFVLVCVLPGLTVPQAAVSSLTSTAISNTAPAGAAFGIGITYAMYVSWGFPPSAVALSVLVSGVWNAFVKLGMPVVALAVLALYGDASTGRVVAALIGVAALGASVAVFALMLRSDAAAERIGTTLGRAVSRLARVVRRGPMEGWGAAAVRFRARTIDLLRGRWFVLTVITVISHLSLYVVLLICLRHIGVSEDEVSWAEVLAAFSFVRLVTALPITPGGAGVVELALTAALVVAGGDRELVVAAVLVFRGLTYLLPIPLGALTYVVWRRRSGWRVTPSDLPGDVVPEGAAAPRG
jgi:putative heme transporter